MARAMGARHAFNRGIISRRALQRVDLKRSALAAEIQNNFLPLVLGPMMLRPGLEYLGSTYQNAKARLIPFIYATDDTALLECTNGILRVWVNDALLTRPTVSSALSNENFDTDLTDWIDADDAGCISAWVMGGYLGLTGTGNAVAARNKEITVALADRNIEHALRIHVTKGTAYLSVGEAENGTNYRNNIALRPGWHSISIVPANNFWIQISGSSNTTTLVSSISLEAPGIVALPTPWAEADLQKLRYDQSGDVVFVANRGGRQQRIERPSTRSWSVVDYQVDDGPFLGQNVDNTTLTASVLTGTGTLTASKPVFHTGHVGALFRLQSSGQNVIETINGDDQWSDPIRVVGVSIGRQFGITVSEHTGTHTLTLQRSIGAVGDWTNQATYVTNTSTTYNDTLDNQIIYYRIGCKAGGHTTGNSVVGLSYAAGSIQGVGRVTEFLSYRQVSVDVVKDFGSTTATSTWWEGQWSDHRGWPSAVCLYEGRLWWAGGDHINGSVSDAYGSFDSTVEGDSGPISRNIGSGPVDDISWLMSLTQLLVGTQGAEMTARSSSLDEPLTPTMFSLKRVSTQGSAPVQGVTIDSSGVFVQRNGYRVYELAPAANGYSYEAHELTAIVPEIGNPGIVAMAVQRQADTRLHCVRSDGIVALLVYDKVEEVNGWITIETDGAVEEVAVLPGDEEDKVYYVVQRTINGGVKRYLEQFAPLSEGVGTTVTKLVDAAFYVAGPVSTVTGLSHLEGESVAVWGNGKDLGKYTVSSGEITLAERASDITVGLPYCAQFKSARLALSQQETLNQRAKIDHVGLILLDTHAQGLKYGQDFDHMDDLPLMEGGAEIDQDAVYTNYGEDAIELDGTWSTDARLCLVACSPRPCTVAAAVISMTENVK